MGREAVPLLKRLVEATERNAKASEKLIELAEEERSVNDTGGPPFCPHCGEFSPSIQVLRATRGSMADFILVANCENCNHTLYGIPEGWQMFRTQDDAVAAMTDGGGNGNSS